MTAIVGSLSNEKRYEVRGQLLLSLFNRDSSNAQSIIAELMDCNVKNEMLAATKISLNNNEGIRNYGNRLGRLPVAYRDLILKGGEIFRSICVSCNRSDGNGMAVGGNIAAAPPISGSKRAVFKEKDTAIKIFFHGLAGPIDGGYSSEMPSMKKNSDEWIASVVSYIKFEFGGNPPRPTGDIPGLAPAAIDSKSGFPVRNIISPIVETADVKKKDKNKRKEIRFGQ